MRIDFVEVANFRKLLSTRIGLSQDKTVFVGANNSGKTSAITALRYFLVDRERSSFCFNDFTLSHWPGIDAMGTAWEATHIAEQALPAPDWGSFLPFLDVWIHVEENEVHYVQKILPTLDWAGGRLGVRVRYQPKEAESLQKDYLAARTEARNLQAAGAALAEQQGQEAAAFQVTIWPQNLVEFLQRRVTKYFTIATYVLDPEACVDPQHGRALPQALDGSDPIDGTLSRALFALMKSVLSEGLVMRVKRSMPRGKRHLQVPYPANCRPNFGNITKNTLIHMKTPTRKTCWHCAQLKRPKSSSTFA